MIFGFGSTSLDWWAYGQNFFRDLEHRRVVQPGLAGREPRSDVQPGRVARRLAARRPRRRRIDFGTSVSSTAARVSDDWYWWRWNGISPDIEVEVASWDRRAERPAPLQGGTRREERARHARGHVRRACLVSGVGIDPGTVARLLRVPPRASSTADDDTISLALAAVDIEAELASEGRADGRRRISVVSDLDPDGRLDLVFDRFTSSFHAGQGATASVSRRKWPTSPPTTGSASRACRR